MNRFLKTTLAVWSLGLTCIFAAEPADNQIKGALMDIERYEKQFAGATSANPSTVNRSLKLLNLTRQRLDGSPNKSHASWKEADARYNKLITHLNNLLNPGSSSSSTPSAPQAPAAPQSARPATPSNSAPPQMISQYRVRIKKIKRDIDSSFQTMDQGGVKPFQDSEYIAKFEQSAQRHAESIAKYADFKTDPDVIAATESLTKYQNMIAFGKEHAAKEHAELGDVQAKLKSINAQIRQLKQPDTPQTPYQEGQLSQWLTQLAQTRQAAVKIHEPLPEIKQRAYLPINRLTVEQGGPYDLNDVDRLERAIIGLVNNIDSSLKSFGENLGHQIPHIKEMLSYYTQYDPTDRNDQTNHFLGEGSAEENRARLAESKQNASEMVQFAKLINDPRYEQTVALNNEVQKTIDLYEQNYQKARELVRMPDAATKDSKLTSIARETLANYDSVGEIKRLVINTEKVHRSQETSEQQFDDVDVSLSGTITLSGTKTTYFYEWDQFQVATAEPVSDKHYIFYNTLKFYTSGDTTTTLNKWILAGRIQGSEIPEGNIDK